MNLLNLLLLLSAIRSATRLEGFEAMSCDLRRRQSTPTVFRKLPVQSSPWFRKMGAIVCLSLAALWSSTVATYAQDRPASSSSTPAPSQPGATAPGDRSVLKLGSSGTPVAELQALLKLWGYYRGAVDGNYQESTARAVSAFQQAAGLQVDGIVGSETWNRLLPAAPVSSTAATTSTPPASSTASTATVPSTPAATGTTFPTPTASTATSGSTFPAPTPTATGTSGTAQPAPTPNSAPSSGSPSTGSPTATTTAPATSGTSTGTLTETSTAATGSTTGNSRSPASEQPSSVELPILRLGMQGPAVARLQERLKAIGFFDGAIDGVFGEETKAAVEAAQRNYDLNPDGVVGPATWTALLQ